MPCSDGTGDRTYIKTKWDIATEKDIKRREEKIKKHSTPEAEFLCQLIKGGIVKDDDMSMELQLWWGEHQLIDDLKNPK